MNDVSLPDHTAFTHRPADHPEVQSGAVGVLVVNLGTPTAPD